MTCHRHRFFLQGTDSIEESMGASLLQQRPKGFYCYTVLMQTSAKSLICKAIAYAQGIALYSYTGIARHCPGHASPKTHTDAAHPWPCTARKCPAMALNGPLWPSQCLAYTYPLPWALRPPQPVLANAYAQAAARRISVSANSNARFNRPFGLMA